MIDLAAAGQQMFTWWQDWRGDYAAIIAAGPSVRDANVAQLQDRLHVIAINESFRLCPWADVLYGCDPDWWHLRKRDTDAFGGIRLTMQDGKHIEGVSALRVEPSADGLGWVNELLLDSPGLIGAGGNGGFQMVNLAAQFGVAGIALVGFDYHDDNGVHWHGPHPIPLRNPYGQMYQDWRKHLDGSAPLLAARGIDVVNCSLASALTAFPKMTIEAMLERWAL